MAPRPNVKDLATLTAAGRERGRQIVDRDELVGIVQARLTGLPLLDHLDLDLERTLVAERSNDRPSSPVSIEERVADPELADWNFWKQHRNLLKPKDER